MRASSTADVTSEIAARVRDAVHPGSGKPDPARLARLSSLQGRIEMLKERGLLKRQAYCAVNSADFRGLLRHQH